MLRADRVALVRSETVPPAVGPPGGDILKGLREDRL